MPWLPNDSASLTNRVDLVANSISIYTSTSDDVQNIHDIFLPVNDIAVLQEETVNVGGGYHYTRVIFDENEVDDWHVPSVLSMVNYLDDYYQKKGDGATSGYKKVLNVVHQEVNDMQVKKTYRVNNTVKRTPVVVNIENNFYYVKRKDSFLAQQVAELAAEVELLKSRTQ